MNTPHDDKNAMDIYRRSIADKKRNAELDLVGRDVEEDVKYRKDLSDNLKSIRSREGLRNFYLSKEGSRKRAKKKLENEQDTSAYKSAKKTSELLRSSHMNQERFQQLDKFYDDLDTGKIDLSGYPLLDKDILITFLARIKKGGLIEEQIVDTDMNKTVLTTYLQEYTDISPDRLVELYKKYYMHLLGSANLYMGDYQQNKSKIFKNLHIFSKQKFYYSLLDSKQYTEEEKALFDRVLESTNDRITLLKQDKRININQFPDLELVGSVDTKEVIHAIFKEWPSTFEIVDVDESTYQYIKNSGENIFKISSLAASFDHKVFAGFPIEEKARFHNTIGYKLSEQEFTEYASLSKRRTEALDLDFDLKEYAKNVSPEEQKSIEHVLGISGELGLDVEYYRAPYTTTQNCNFSIHKSGSGSAIIGYKHTYIFVSARNIYANKHILEKLLEPLTQRVQALEEEIGNMSRYNRDEAEEEITTKEAELRQPQEELNFFQNLARTGGTTYAILIRLFQLTYQEDFSAFQTGMKGGKGAQWIPNILEIDSTLIGEKYISTVG